MGRKKLLFCSRYFIDENNHLAKKFSQQISAIEEIGIDVSYIGISKNYIILFCNGELQKNLLKRSNIKIPFIRNIILYNKIYKSLNKILKENAIFDYIYCRSMFPLFSSWKALKNAKKKNIKVIMEIPTYPPENEYKTEKNWFRRKILLFTIHASSKLSKYVDLYTLIGEKANMYMGKPAINISNGIDVSIFPVRNKSDDKVIDLLALATMCRWHGYDRLLYGLYNYIQPAHNQKDSRNVVIHFVGGDGDGTLKELKQMTNDLGLENNVRFYGPLYGKQLDDIFNKCDIGVASLGLHRKNIKSTSELKIREYVARGLPIIYSSIDDCIDKDYPFALFASQDEEPIDFNEVINFYDRVHCIPNAENIIRQYAELKMTWKSQFEKVFSILEGDK